MAGWMRTREPTAPPRGRSSAAPTLVRTQGEIPAAALGTAIAAKQGVNRCSNYGAIKITVSSAATGFRVRPLRTPTPAERRSLAGRRGYKFPPDAQCSSPRYTGYSWPERIARQIADAPLRHCSRCGTYSASSLWAIGGSAMSGQSRSRTAAQGLRRAAWRTLWRGYCSRVAAIAHAARSHVHGHPADRLRGRRPAGR